MAGERVDLDAVEKLGEYVSDCRWSAEAGVVRGLDGATYPEIATAVRAADAEWIAHFDPPTVLAIAAELRELRERYGKDDEVWCGARRDQAGTAYCVEMAGHGEYGYPHMWGRHAAPSTPDRSEAR